MKVCIFYFSGTGNTKKVVLQYAAELEKLGCTTELKNIDDYYGKDVEVDLNEYDKIGIAYPIHAFNAPHIVLAFAKRLKKLNAKKDLFIVKTSGEPLKLNNISSIKLTSILKRKNLILKNEYHYCMPYNIIFRHSDSMAYKMWESAKLVIPFDCKEIIEGRKAKLSYFPFGRFLAWTFRVEHWGGRFNGKRYKVGEKCVQCGMCVKRCPTKNITIENGEFKFGKNCLMCMRCSFFCPKDAIRIGLFEKWKVNGAYNFEPSEDEESHKRYCKKAYKKYFDKIDAKSRQKD